VGGDYYDFLDLGPGRLGLVLADISGKGISAALLMAHLQANLRCQYALAMEDPLRLLQSVNHIFRESTDPGRFATIFFASYEEATHRLRYANCGHNPPLLLRADGRVEWLGGTAMVLGLFEDWTSTIEEVELAAGDILVIYTDGVTEAKSDEGEDFGEQRLLQAVRASSRLAAAELLDKLVTTVQIFSGSEQEDDLTLLVARVR
jgi:serine phosphatase RsbU (regulator of sigma subunit)